MEKECSSAEFGEEFILMVNAFPGAVVMFDKSETVKLWNSAAENITGFSAEEVLEKKFSEIMNSYLNMNKEDKIPENFLDSIFEIKGRKSFYHGMGFIRAKDFSEKILDYSISPVNINENWYGVFVARDISYDLERDYEKNYLYNLVKSSNDAIIGIDLEKNIISWNAGAEKLYGYSESEVLGKSISVLIPQRREDEISFEIEKVKQNKEIKNFQTERKTKSGKVISILISVSPIKNKSGEVIGASVFATDISREKEMYSTMIRYISEAAMRLKNPVEHVRMNLFNILSQVKNDEIEKDALILNLSLQIKNTEQILFNLRELNQALIGSYEDFPEDYIKYFNR